jgi:hypothetical protein
MPSIWDQTAGVSKWLVVSMVIVSSVISGVMATWFFLWLGAGGRRGIFWASFGSMQYVYFSIVIAAICSIVFMGSVFRWGATVSICAAAFAGYIGSVIAYYFLAFDSIERTMRNHPEFVVAPLILPTHLIFVAGGAGAGLLMFGLLMAYRALKRIGLQFLDPTARSTETKREDDSRST